MFMLLTLCSYGYSYLMACNMHMIPQTGYTLSLGKVVNEINTSFIKCSHMWYKFTYFIMITGIQLPII